MSISALDLLQHAERVLSGAGGETEFRTSIGRAYYAAMHCSKAFHSQLQSKGASPKNRAGSHAKLIQQLLHPTTKEQTKREQSIKLGLDLKGMKAMRTLADYELGEAVTRSDAEDTVEQAQLIFSGG